MAEEYSVPFKVDANPVLKSFEDMAKGSEKLGSDTEKAAKDMQSAFDKAATSGETLNKKIKEAAVNSASLVKAAEAAGKQINEALSGKGMDGQFESKISKIRESLSKITSKSVYLGISFDEKKVSVLEAEIKKAASAQEAFNTVIDFGRQKLSTLQEGSQDYVQLAKDIKYAEQLVTMLGEAQEKVVPQTEVLANKFDDLLGDPGRFLTVNQLETLDKKIDGSATEVVRLENVVQTLATQLSTLDPGSAQFSELTAIVEAGKEALTAYGSELASVTGIEEVAATKTQTLRARIRELKDQMAQLSADGEGGGDEFAALADEAGTLQQQVNEANEAVNTLGSSSRNLEAGVQGIQALAGAFAVGQGVMGLFGVESEKTQIIIQRVTSALAILQGVQALSNVLSKEGALVTTVMNLVRGRSAVVTAEVAAAETAAAVATTEVAASEVAATATTNAWTAALLANPIFAIGAVIAAVVVALYAFTSGTNEAAEAVKKFSDELELQNNLLLVSEGNLERATNIRLAQARNAGAKESELTGIELDALKKRLEGRKDYADQMDQNYRDYVELEDADEKTSKEYYDRSLSANQDYLNLKNQIAVKEIDQQTQSASELKDARDKADAEAEKARNKRIADERKAAAERKRISDQILKFTKEAQNAEIGAMKDGVAKQAAELNAKASQQIEALNAEIALTQKAAILRKKAIENINRELDANLTLLAQEEANKRANIQLTANAMLIEFYQDNAKNELAIQQNSYEDKRQQITVQYKDEIALRNLLLDALSKQNETKQRKIKEDSAINSLSIEEQNAIAGVELMAKYAGNSARVEEAKQQEILRIQLIYAERQLALIQDDGKAETILRINQAKKVVADTKKALGQAVTESKGKTDFFDLIGLGDVSDATKDSLTMAANKSLESLTQITSFINDQYQRQIDKKQEVIDQYDKELDDLEERLDKEKELRENGFANNVEVLEAEIASKKAAKEEELRQQEELQKKQQQLQKAQLVVDTAVQASNLVVAATSIFKSFATIPFGLGIPLAIATVALMTGAFTVGKIKAFQAVNDGAKFGEGGAIGGEVKGNKHTSGGVKYRSDNPNAGVVELEGGEYVIKSSSYRKHPELTHMLNEGDISGLSDEHLRRFLGSLGISMNTDAPNEAVTAVALRDAMQMHITNVSNYDIPGMESIAQDVSYLAESAKNKTVTWEDDRYYYSKTGNKVTKRKKS